MTYFTTRFFFQKMRELKAKDLPPSKARIVRNYYAFAAKHFAISEAQFDVLMDIAFEHGIDIGATLFTDDSGVAHAENQC